MSATRIEWADDTENAAGGCSEARLRDGRMDPACVNCYARLQSARNASMGSALYEGVADRHGNTATWSGLFRWDRDLLTRRFDRMVGGHRVFLGSMTDLWHEGHDPDLLVALADEIRRLGSRVPSKRPHLITLTKRADRLLAWQREHFSKGLPEWCWPGVTAGCQEAADERLPVLLDVHANGPLVLSAEPLASSMNLHPWLKCGTCSGTGLYGPSAPDSACRHCAGTGRGLGWVIAGGESGAKARPSHPDWFRALRDQCAVAEVPFFFKQWGEWAPGEEVEANRTDWTGMYEQHPDDGGVPQHSWPDAPVREAARRIGRGEIPHAVDTDTTVLRVGKKAAGRLLDGRTHDEVPTPRRS